MELGPRHQLKSMVKLGGIISRVSISNPKSSNIKGRLYYLQ
jgi:hypothetical protein